jgi:hypothetical protein
LVRFWFGLFLFLHLNNSHGTYSFFFPSTARSVQVSKSLNCTVRSFEHEKSKQQLINDFQIII